ncbi:MAG: hypothetical protein M5U19_20280 [Microthrixaceae bacterium]|nr:hypothetical protein [Microthrixaceae bacterium]
MSDSFIAQGGRSTPASLLLALDSGADVIQEALGVISNPHRPNRRSTRHTAGCSVIASMAGEQSNATSRRHWSTRSQ